MIHKSVVVQFNESGSEYVYNIPPGDDPKPGDVVVTSVSLDYNKYSRYDAKMKAARVKEISNQQSNRYYLQLIPIDHFDRQKILTTALQNRNKNMEEAKRRLKELVEDYTERNVLKRLIDENSEAAHLNAFINGETDEYEP